MLAAALQSKKIAEREEANDKIKYLKRRTDREMVYKSMMESKIEKQRKQLNLKTEFVIEKDNMERHTTNLQYLKEKESRKKFESKMAYSDELKV